MGRATAPGAMTPHWLQLRWPFTLIILGGMATALLLRSSEHPIKLQLQLSFSEPLSLKGTIHHQLHMPEPVQVESRRDIAVKVTEQAPIQVSVTNPTPVQVQVSNPAPIEVKVKQTQPMQVDVDPTAPVKVNMGL